MLRRYQLPHLSYHARLRLLLLPYLLGIGLLVVLPALLSFGLAFFRYDALSPPIWAGWRNFILIYTDELFALSVQNSLALVLLAVPLRVAAALLLALLLRRAGRGLGLFRASVYLPSIIPSAAYALAWLWIFNPLAGPLNLLLRAVGLAPPSWLIDPLWAKPALIFMSLWQIGEGLLVALVALHDLPPEIEDAAYADGAGAWQRFWHITLPIIAPLLLLLALRDIVLVTQESFVATMLMTRGGPYYATYTLPLFIYEQGFDLFSFGTASAALWVLYGMTGLLVLVLYVLARQWEIGVTDDNALL